jgi:hypothetical protein
MAFKVLVIPEFSCTSMLNIFQTVKNVQCNCAVMNEP